MPSFHGIVGLLLAAYQEMQCQGKAPDCRHVCEHASMWSSLIYQLDIYDVKPSIRLQYALADQ